jgi:hypothetical protein
MTTEKNIAPRKRSLLELAGDLSNFQRTMVHLSLA